MFLHKLNEHSTLSQPSYIIYAYSNETTIMNVLTLQFFLSRSSQVVRRPDNSDENSSNTSSYCGSGFPLPFGSIPGLVDMAGSCHEDMLAQYRHIHLPNVSSKGSSLKELTDPSTLKLRKRYVFVSTCMWVSHFLNVTMTTNASLYNITLTN